ncbi:hypothetical protein MRX96_043233 [Rhipicephalus microplus]
MHSRGVPKAASTHASTARLLARLARRAQLSPAPLADNYDNPRRANGEDKSSGREAPCGGNATPAILAGPQEATRSKEQAHQLRPRPCRSRMNCSPLTRLAMMNGPMDWTDAVLSQPRLQTRRGGSARSARRFYTHRYGGGNPWQAWLQARRRDTAAVPQPSGEWRQRAEGESEEGDAPFFPCSSSSWLHVCQPALSASLLEGN